MDAQPCPICFEPVNCGQHRLERNADGSPLLVCPSFEEFVLDTDTVLLVDIPRGVPDGSDDHEQGTPA